MGDSGCDREEHERLWDRIRDVETYVEQRLKEEREYLADRLDKIGAEVRTYIFYGQSTSKEVLMKVTALHERLDQHLKDEKEKLVESKATEKEKRDESKILKKEKRGWVWGLATAIILFIIERAYALIVWVYEKLQTVGGKP